MIPSYTLVGCMFNLPLSWQSSSSCDSAWGVKRSKGWVARRMRRASLLAFVFEQLSLRCNSFRSKMMSEPTPMRRIIGWVAFSLASRYRCTGLFELLLVLLQSREMLVTINAKTHGKNVWGIWSFFAWHLSYFSVCLVVRRHDLACFLPSFLPSLSFGAMMMKPGGCNVTNSVMRHTPPQTK